jgi:hypothetical protein
MDGKDSTSICCLEGGTKEFLNKSNQSIAFTRVDDKEVLDNMIRTTSVKKLGHVLKRQEKRSVRYHNKKIHDQLTPLVVIIKHIPNHFFQDDDIQRIFMNSRFYKLQVVFDIDKNEYGRIPPCVRMNLMKIRP